MAGAVDSRTSIVTVFNDATTGTYRDGQAAASISEADHRDQVSRFAASMVVREDLRPIQVTGGDAYTATVSGYTTGGDTAEYGGLLLLKFDLANTGPATLQISSGTEPGTAYSIKKNVSEALQSGDIAANEIIVLAFDQTNYQIVGRRSVAAVPAASATATPVMGITNLSDTDDKWYKILWYAGSNAGGNQDIAASSILPNDSVAQITLYAQGVSADGSEGYSGVLVAGFRKDGAATPVQIGSTTILHAVEDSSGTPSVAIAMNSTNIRVTMVTSGVVVYHWTIWAEIAVSAV